MIGAVAGYCRCGASTKFPLDPGKEGCVRKLQLLARSCLARLADLLPIVIGAAGVGALVGITAIVLKARDKGIPMAFGPYLAAAGWLVLMFGPELVGAYLGLYAPR